MAGQDAIVLMSMGMGFSLLAVCLLYVLYYYYYLRLQGTQGSTGTTGKTSGTSTTKPKCPAKRKDCAYTRRILYEGKWQCPGGFEDTGCDWSHGKTKGELQCRACGENNPYAQYFITNPNCPPGFQPCNQPPFNYGDLKKNANGEYYYDKGWGVEDTGSDPAKAADPYGGSVLLNVGKWGGTDAHPEVFAKGCCAWGNSVDDPERDAANKKIKIASFAVSGVIDAAAAVAAMFTGGLSLAGSLALHGATTAASTGVSTGGQLIRAKCGGPTERYKKTKRSYIFKGPYKDGARIRGTPGIWYTSGDGCPLKWLQYVPPQPKK